MPRQTFTARAALDAFTGRLWTRDNLCRVDHEPVPGEFRVTGGDDGPWTVEWKLATDTPKRGRGDREVEPATVTIAGVATAAPIARPVGQLSQFPNPRHADVPGGRHRDRPPGVSKASRATSGRAETPLDTGAPGAEAPAFFQQLPAPADGAVVTESHPSSSSFAAGHEPAALFQPSASPPGVAAVAPVPSPGSLLPGAGPHHPRPAVPSLVRVAVAPTLAREWADDIRRTEAREEAIRLKPSGRSVRYCPRCGTKRLVVAGVCGSCRRTVARVVMVERAETAPVP